jgi:hypothetical protein
MKINPGFIILIVTVLFFSCSKDDSSNNDPSPGTCRMIRLYDSLGETDFFYDADNRISRIRSIYSPSDSSWENYYYDNGHVSHVIISYKGFPGDTIYCTYESGKYTECFSYGDTLKYKYDASNHLTRIESWRDLKMDGYTDYQYDSRGNCTAYQRYSRYGTGYGLSQEGSLEFGTNKNFYYSIGIPPLNSLNEAIPMTVSPNNFIKVTTKFPSSVNSIVVLYTYSGFNDHGYPTNFSMSDSSHHMYDFGTIDYVCP